MRDLNRWVTVVASDKKKKIKTEKQKFVVASETHSLYLGCVCSQSCSESSHTVFMVVKPSKILQKEKNLSFIKDIKTKN